jgi:N-acetylneuraminic acid mutarotase
MNSLLKPNGMLALLIPFIFWTTLPRAEGKGGWVPIDHLNRSRTSHTLTLLANGKVLAAGGFHFFDFSEEWLASAELYDPETEKWNPTGSMSVEREDHSATLLTNGKVLVAGGENDYGTTISSAELYDPSTGTWTTTGSMHVERAFHTATLLTNGKVLVVGRSAELFDPSTGTWTMTSSLHEGHGYGHTATLLANGKVLVAGGGSAELYDPTAGTWTGTGAMLSKHEMHTATLLTNGKVIVAGGISGDRSVSNAEIYDPSAGTWTATNAMKAARDSHIATLLVNGKVLVAGGRYRTKDKLRFNEKILSSSEIYDPVSETWSTTGPLNAARGGLKATLLPNGKVISAGGVVTDEYDNISYSTTGSELYEPELASARIKKSPKSRTIRKGARTTLRVDAAGISLSYQWYRGNKGDTSNPIKWANSSKYKTPALKKTTKYWVMVRNSAGSARSKTATISIR